MSRKLLPVCTAAAGIVLVALGVAWFALFPLERMTRSFTSLFVLLLPAGVVLLVIGCLAYAFGGSGVRLRVHHSIEIVAGLLLILVGQFLVFMSGLAALLAMCMAMVLLIVGCFPLSHKLPPVVTLAVGAALLGMALSAAWYVPLAVPFPPAGPDDAAGLLIHLINFTTGIPGAVFLLGGVLTLCHRIVLKLQRNQDI